MDPKKQELNPELKQIYDRVMNTQAARPQQPAQTPPAQPQPGTPPPPAPSQNYIPSVPPTPPIQPQPVPPGGTAPTPQNAQSQPAPAAGTVPQQLGVPNSGSFVFTGNKVIAPKTDAKGQPIKSQAAMGGKKGIPGILIVVGVVLLVVVWGIVWAKIFGLF